MSKVTYKELCEDIAKHLRTYGLEVTGEQVWRCSPSGEIWPIHDLEYFVRLVEEKGMSEQAALAQFSKSYPRLYERWRSKEGRWSKLEIAEDILRELVNAEPGMYHPVRERAYKYFAQQITQENQ